MSPWCRVLEVAAARRTAPARSTASSWVGSRSCAARGPARAAASWSGTSRGATRAPCVAWARARSSAAAGASRGRACGHLSARRTGLGLGLASRGRACGHLSARRTGTCRGSVADARRGCGRGASPVASGRPCSTPTACST
eukprot:7378242-Prymnesium_polylepis.1